MRVFLSFYLFFIRHGFESIFCTTCS